MDLQKCGFKYFAFFMIRVHWNCDGNNCERVGFSVVERQPRTHICGCDGKKSIEWRRQLKFHHKTSILNHFATARHFGGEAFLALAPFTARLDMCGRKLVEIIMFVSLTSWFDFIKQSIEWNAVSINKNQLWHRFLIQPHVSSFFPFLVRKKAQNHSL